MKESELRIGNWVRYRDKQNVIVSNIGNHFETIADYSQMPYGSDDINEYNPIPLIGELLIKVGFKRYVSQAYDLYTIEVKGTSFSIKGGDRFYYNGFELKTVHQLQNLYFALTGEELTINI